MNFITFYIRLVFINLINLINKSKMKFLALCALLAVNGESIDTFDEGDKRKEAFISLDGFSATQGAI